MPKPRLIGGKPLMIGGKVALSDDCCCGGPTPPPFDCLSPDLPEIILTYGGIMECFPDPGTFPPAELINGSFTLLNVGPSQWFGGIHYCYNPDTAEWRQTAEECEMGEEQHNRDFEVTCVDGLMSVSEVYDGGGGWFSNPSGTPPTVTNFVDCPDGLGGGGTATVTVP